MKLHFAKPVTLQWVVIKDKGRTVVLLNMTKVYGGGEGVAALDSRSWVSSQRSARLYYAACGHICKLCI
jgi:hypothetical protein